MEEDKKILENIGIMKLKDGLSYDEAIEYKFAIDNLLNELKRLQKENEDWQKAYQEEKDEQFNMIIKKCSHCENDTPLYCENCYQELISKNAELQLEIEKLKKKHKIICGLNVELLENIEYFIPKQVIRNKIQLLEKELKLLDKNDKHTIIENDYIISVLKELLGE